MKLLFDASELTPSSAKSIGIYRYAVGLATAMSTQLGSGESMLIVCNGDNEADFAPLGGQAQVHVLKVQARMPGHVWRQWWNRLGCALFVRSQGLDTYFSPKGFIPRGLAWPRGVRRTCVVHDLIPYWYYKQHPTYFGLLERVLVREAFRCVRLQADIMVAISHETRTHLVNWGVPPERLHVVHNGVDQIDDTTLQAQLPQVNGPFIFAMASPLPHKNLQGILEGYRAYRALAGDAARPLLMCGVSGIVQEGVVALGRVSDAALRGLYQESSVFVFLSFIEGFGYPPLEALRFGTRVLCSNLPVFQEICGDRVTYVPPDQPQQVGQQMLTLMSQPWPEAQRAALKAQARALIAREFDWGMCAQGVLAAVRRGAAPAKASKGAS
jgi:glycosyltransferase involved in cell wall biosynthesis